MPANVTFKGKGAAKTKFKLSHPESIKTMSLSSA